MTVYVHTAACAALRKGWRSAPGGRSKIQHGPASRRDFVPGVAVLLEFLKDFKLPAVIIRGRVRDGIIGSGRAHGGAELSRLTRDPTVGVGMCRRYGVSLENARKVAHIEGLLFTPASAARTASTRPEKLLEAAATWSDAGLREQRGASQAFSLRGFPTGYAGSPSAAAVDRGLCRFTASLFPRRCTVPTRRSTRKRRRTSPPSLSCGWRIIWTAARQESKPECAYGRGSRHLCGSNGESIWKNLGSGACERAFRKVYNRVVTISKARTERH